MTTGEPASPAALAELDRLGRREVPADYRTFIGQSDGATFEEMYSVFLTPFGVRSSLIRRFVPVLGTGGVSESTMSMRHDGYLPDTALVIAEDVGGNLLVLSVEASTHGTIYFWDHERASSEQANTDSLADFAYSLTRVASSFDQLLAEVLCDATEAERRLAQLKGSPLPPIPSPPPDRPPASNTDSVVLHHKAKAFDLMPKPFAAASVNDGVAIAATWAPVEAKWNPNAESGSYDLLEAARSVAVRPEVVLQVGPIFERYGELLTFETPTGPIHYFRCLNIADVLLPATKLRASSDQVLIDEPIFDLERAAAAGIFTVPEQPVKPRVFFASMIADEIHATGIRHRPFLPLTTAWY